MSCASEGAVDVYIEPHLPARTLLVAGFTPVADDARALRRAARRLSRRARRRTERSRRVPPTDTPPDARGCRSCAGFSPRWIRAIARGSSPSSHRRATTTKPHSKRCSPTDAPAYVGLLASRKRAADVFDALARTGIAASISARAQSGRTRHRRARPATSPFDSCEIIDSRAREPQPKPCDRGRLPSIRSAGWTSRSRRHARARTTAALSLLLRTAARRSRRTRALRDAGARVNAPSCASALPRRGYVADEDFATALELMLALEKPLLVEGPAGVGKTESAKVLADVLEHEPHPPAVLRRARRGERAVRMELSEAAPAHPPHRERGRPARGARGADLQRASSC